jgi:transcriptional regulator with XRE-family HTH domain
MGSKAGDDVAKKVLGDNIKKYRTAAKMSIRALATAALVSPSQIMRIESGEINTSVSTIFTIANALGIKPSQLLEE